jgi:hypothetical protein
MRGERATGSGRILLLLVASDWQSRWGPRAAACSDRRASRSEVEPRRARRDPSNTLWHRSRCRQI